MSKHWQQTVEGFGANDRGSVAMLFGLLSFVLFFIGAFAVDVGRAVDMKSSIATAVDTASLAAGRAMLDGKLSDGAIADMATTYFNENVKNVKSFGTIGQPEISIDRPNGTVSIDVKSSVKLTLARVSGFKTFDLPVTSTATYQQKDIEIGMALDITGSMDEVIGGTRKIDGLKKAFENFADKLIPDNPTAGESVRIGVAPFSAAVNLGSYSDPATDKRSKDHCVTERRDGEFSDAVVVPAKVGSTTNPTAFFVKADGSSGYVCPAPHIMPLSSDKTALVNAVNGFSPSGATAGHIGIQWAYNLISDKWGGVWGGTSAPASYSLTTGKSPTLVKAVILMTDGIFNTSYHNGTAVSQALKLCSAIKDQTDKNVVVFTIGFGLGGDPVAIQTLKSCATPSPTNDYFVNANDSGELDTALQKFAGKLSELRISK